MLAVISDIHSNTEALSAVLADIRQRGIERIFCLGDVIGYGPNPKECLDMVHANCQVVIMGNHDYATLYEPSRFNLGAENAVYWTRRQLESEADPDAAARRWDFLGSLEVRHVISGEEYGLSEAVFVHGSPRRPINEYVFPDDVFSNKHKLTSVFERFGHICFVGHTHLPGVFTESMDFFDPDDLDYVYDISSSKALINVGSVGQPRDRDPRASYAILEPEKVTFVRVHYDWQTTMNKVHSIPALDDYLGTRLQEGR